MGIDSEQIEHNFWEIAEQTDLGFDPDAIALNVVSEHSQTGFAAELILADIYRDESRRDVQRQNSAIALAQLFGISTQVSERALRQCEQVLEYKKEQQNG